MLNKIIFLSFASLCFGGLVDRAQDLADMRYPKMEGYFRVELFVDRLDTQGKSHTGLWCDSPFDRCDPKVKCFIDTEKPNNDFGGDSVPYDNYVVLFEGNNVDVPEIKKTISRDVCAKSPRKIAIRCRAIDKDTVNDDKIDNYKWPITSDKFPIAENEQSSEWSAEIAVPGEDRPGSKIYVKARLYNIPETQCRPSSNGQGLFSGLFSK